MSSDALALAFGFSAVHRGLHLVEDLAASLVLAVVAAIDGWLLHRNTRESTNAPDGGHAHDQQLV